MLENFNKVFLISMIVIHLFSIFLSNINAITSYGEQVESGLPTHSQDIIDALKILTPNRSNLFFETVSLYSEISGTNTGYGFFAPDLPSSTIVEFEITDTTGYKYIVPTLLNTREGMERFKSGIDFFKQFENFREVIMRSWALRVFEQHPDAKYVTVVIKREDLPSIAQYKKGKRTKQTELFKYNFSLNEY